MPHPSDPKIPKCDAEFHGSTWLGHGVPRYLSKHDFWCVSVSGWDETWLGRLRLKPFHPLKGWIEQKGLMRKDLFSLSPTLSLSVHLQAWTWAFCLWTWTLTRIYSIGFPGAQASRQTGTYIIGFPGSPACRLQILGPLNLSNEMSRFLKINLSLSLPPLTLPLLSQ